MWIYGRSTLRPRWLLHSKRSIGTIHVLFASQGGTAQYFANDLAKHLPSPSNLQPIHLAEAPRSDDVVLILASTAGLGEAPDHARGVSLAEWNDTRYAIFGLGNARAHPNHFCAYGKELRRQLEDGNTELVPLTLGDDGEDIDEDYENWKGEVMQVLKELRATEGGTTDDASATETSRDVITPPGGTLSSGRHPPLKLESRSSDKPVFSGVGFYASGTCPLPVVEHTGSTATLCEMTLQLPQEATYQTGDHLLVYPQNPQYLVDAYMELVLDRSEDVWIADASPSYPHPINISLRETLQHCADLMSVPSASLLQLIGAPSSTATTVLELCVENNYNLSLEDLLYNLPALRPRYYSIASSNRVSPHRIRLIYRPVRYVHPANGSLRVGCATDYLLRQPRQIQGVLTPNPGFRLPKDHNVPVLLIAGGCGVAPIRAMVEERDGKNCHVCLGLRPHDDAPDWTVDEMIVSRDWDLEALLPTEMVWQLWKAGGSTYICGGAKNFGAAIRRRLLEIAQVNTDDPQQYLNDLVQQDRLLEELAD